MTELQAVWGWQPALYLFLGGLSAGAFIAATVLYFRDKAANIRVVCASCWLAFVCLGLGLVLLLTELSNPLRGMMMWQSFSNFSSWMAIGAWALALAMVAFVLMALLCTSFVTKCLQKDGKESGGLDAVRRVVAIIGSVLAFVVAAYTGILLMAAPGVPLWNTALLPCLFVVSGLDTGVALVEVVAALSKNGISKASSRLLSRCVIVLVVAEIVVLAVFLGLSLAGKSFAGDAAGLLVSGSLALPFWGLVVVLGLLLPLSAAIIQIRHEKIVAPTAPAPSPDGSTDGKAAAAVKGDHGLALVGAAGALVGGCALRFIVLSAGIHGDVIGALVATL